MRVGRALHCGRVGIKNKKCVQEKQIEPGCRACVLPSQWQSVDSHQGRLSALEPSI